MAREYYNTDMRLFLDHRVDWRRYLQLRRGAQADIAAEVAAFHSVLETTAQVCEDIEDDSRAHWDDAVRLENGTVVVPGHIARGYERLKSAGLVCLTLEPAYGGYGLPILLNSYVLEMISRADPSLMTIVGLQTGVSQDIQKYGSADLRQQWLPRFAAGELQGAMDLTESQAGSDLGGIVTRVSEENGRFFVDGEKIFITNGGAEVHLVLARDAATFDESRGTTNGLSLMLCPRTRDDGTPNGVTVGRIEHKKGIHGSPTCSVEFQHAEARVLGERGQGFRAMLDLMNNARLGVAAQAIGIAEAAYRQARQYAADRVQFGAPILRQPLIKSMLTNMAIHIHAARALLGRTCVMIDTAEAIRVHLESSGDGGAGERAALQAELDHLVHVIRLFTPLCKFYATEISVDATRKGIQIHGGVGYMAETYAGHFHEDAIITTIYEGTSEIQASFALKEMSKGALLTTLAGLREELAVCGDACKDLVAKVLAGIDRVANTLPALMSDPQYALLNAKRLCEMVIDLVVSAELLRQAGCSERRLADERLALATTFIHRRMIVVEANAARITSGDASRLARYDTILGM